MAASAGRSPIERLFETGWVSTTLHLEGLTPVLMSSDECDRRSDTYRAYRTLSRKRSRTEKEDDLLRELEWTTRLYWDKDVGPYMPSRWIHRALRNGAPYGWGAKVGRWLRVLPLQIPLQYDGPREPKKLYEAGFYDTRMVANAGASKGRVERCRPCFDGWSVDCEIVYDPRRIDHENTLTECCVEMEAYGVGDFRPDSGGDFGQFASTLGPENERKDSDVNGDASKPIRKRSKKALDESVKRIKTAS